MDIKFVIPAPAFAGVSSSGYPEEACPRESGDGFPLKDCGNDTLSVNLDGNVPKWNLKDKDSTPVRAWSFNTYG